MWSSVIVSPGLGPDTALSLLGDLERNVQTGPLIGFGRTQVPGLAGSSRPDKKLANITNLVWTRPADTIHHTPSANPVRSGLSSCWDLYGNFSFNIPSRFRVPELEKCVITSIKSCKAGSFCSYLTQTRPLPSYRSFDYREPRTKPSRTR